MAKERIHWIDNAKGIGIMWVVLQHVNLQTTTVIGGVLKASFSAICVAIFWSISGWLLGIKWEKKGNNIPFELKKKVKTYILPFFVFSILYTLECTILMYFSNSHEALVYLQERLLGTLMLQGNGANWFLPNLFIAEIVLIIEIRSLSPRIFVPVNLILGCLAFLLPFDHRITILWVFQRVLQGMVIMSFGLMIGKYKIDKKLLKLKLIIALISVYIFATIINGAASTFDVNYGKYWWLRYPQLCIGCLSLMLFCEKCLTNTYPFLTLLGRNSIIVMSTHKIIEEVVWVIDGKWLHILPVFGVHKGLVLWIALLVLEIPVIHFMNRYLPFLYGKPLQSKGHKR